MIYVGLLKEYEWRLGGINILKAFTIKRVILYVSILCLCLLYLSMVSCSKDAKDKPENICIRVSEKMLHCKYFDEKDFQQSINAAEQTANNPNDNNLLEDGNVFLGGIVPHHLLSSEMISSFFMTLSKEEPEIIVIIAPNHHGIGVKTVHTGSWSWQTPFGILETDKDIVNSLIDSKIADTNFDLLEQEHSISGLVPYVKYYMPESKIVPILLHGSYSLKEAQLLGQNIQKKLESENKRSLVIASVDFSHYLTLEQAEKMDEISIKSIENRDLHLIYSFNNDYLDSPPSLIALLSALDVNGPSPMKILDHSNSDIIAGTRNDETTSYFTVVFYGLPH